ncbi:MAG: deoxyribose-phosphate aldolase [Erysipelotrichaceae bacterium]|jgi:deoxyribose-phosphate aldolase
MKINKYIDHTLLKPAATTEQIKELCLQAKEYDFASVCVNSCYVPLAKEILEGTDVKVCCVVGFPLGAMATISKVFETEQAIREGATEIDMVINIGAAKEGNWKYVKEDIAAVVKAAEGNTVKVIIETCLLTDEEKVLACKCAMDSEAHFVKTSTGFSTAGATVEDVKMMKETVGNNCLVKAAGGVRSLEDAYMMISAGADRLGCSAGVTIMKEYRKQK